MLSKSSKNRRSTWAGGPGPLKLPLGSVPGKVIFQSWFAASFSMLSSYQQFRCTTVLCLAVLMCSCEMWWQAAQASVQELRQMVFDMDSDVKSGIDKRSSQEQDFRKLGFQVLLTVLICLHCFDLILMLDVQKNGVHPDTDVSSRSVYTWFWLVQWSSGRVLDSQLTDALSWPEHLSFVSPMLRQTQPLTLSGMGYKQ